MTETRTWDQEDGGLSPGHLSFPCRTWDYLNFKLHLSRKRLKLHLSTPTNAHTYVNSFGVCQLSNLQYLQRRQRMRSLEKDQSNGTARFGVPLRIAHMGHQIVLSRNSSPFPEKAMRLTNVIINRQRSPELAEMTAY
jgi:hypothetical protein